MNKKQVNEECKTDENEENEDDKKNIMEDLNERQLYLKSYSDFYDSIVEVVRANIIMDTSITLNVKLCIRSIHEIIKGIKDSKGSKVKQITLLLEISKTIDVMNVILGNLTRNMSAHSDKLLVDFGKSYRIYINALHDYMSNILESIGMLDDFI